MTAACSSLLRRRVLAAGGALLGSALLPPFARAGGAWQPALLAQARQRDMTSTITGQRYRIFVNVPETPAPAAGYRVLYALDGNASFPLLALMARTASRRREAAAVIVGIGYAGAGDYDPAGRTRDYTPPAARSPAGEGGADRFLDIIEPALKPLGRSLAAVDPQQQALYGHSFGGLCTLHALLTRPGMFQTYIAASPSIWYRERIVLAGLDGLEKRAAALAVKPSLLLTAGELEQPAPASAGNGAQAGPRDAILAQRRMVDAARELAARLAALQGTMAHVQFQLLAHENHGSAAFPAMSRGMELFLG
jgi:predicted alpha/beta superfamily hydrolase